MPNSPFTIEFLNALAASGVGSVIGMAFKMMRSPPPTLWQAVGGAFTAITVGTLVGGMCSEYFQLGPWITSSAAAAAAYISDELLRGIEVHGKRLRQGKLPISKKED
jgi:CDP-diglyceride synthetase